MAGCEDAGWPLRRVPQWGTQSAVGLLAGLLLAGSLPQAWSDPPEVFAIRDARIVPVSGPPLEKGTVVIREGLIEAVGAGVAIPPEARIYEGKNLTVYPGLIDAGTEIGLPTPPPSSSSPPPRSPDAPPEDPDQQAHVRVADMLAVANSKIEAARQSGFTTVLTLPNRGIFAGQSALVNLNGDRDTAVVRSPVALHLRLSSARSGYPGSLMGVLAYIRQTFLDARRNAEAWSLYAQDPLGLRRPETHRTWEALRPAARRELPVAIPGGDPPQIVRALELAETLDVNPFLLGGNRAGETAKALAAKRVPVLLTVNFPEKPKNPDPDEEESLRSLRQRVEAPKNPGELHRAGVRFAFASEGLASRDFLRNIRRSVQAGLPPDTALRALTLTAAEILGAERQLGSLERGKIANLTVTDGDLFAEKTRVRFLFIDGRHFEPGKTAPAAPAAARPAEDHHEEDHR